MRKDLRQKIKRFLWHENSDSYARILWILLAVVLAVLAFVRPAKRTVTFHYSNAVYHWWGKEDLYGFGYLYFPQALHLYTPFAWQKWPENHTEFNQRPFSETVKTHFRLRMGEAFFRVCTVAFFAFAIYQLAGVINGRDGPDNSFFVISLLSLPALVTAAANGQFNTLLAASMVLAAVSVARKRWNWATFWLTLGVIVKPLGVVPLLLFGALYPPLWKRLPIGVVVIVLFGFLHYDQAYVIEQWKGCIEMLLTASVPASNTFDDLSSMLRVFGLDIGHGIWFYIRAFFAVVFLGVSWLLIRKTDAAYGALLVGAAAATYLMLFNPRTETVSFHILAPYVAALATAMFRGGIKSYLAWLFVFLCIGWGSDNYGDIYKITRLWWKPFLALVFMVILFTWAFAKESVLNRLAPAREET